MLFNSIEFLLFFPLVVILYFITSPSYRWILLLAASYYFYMVWEPFYIVLIIISTVVDYWCGQQMGRRDSREKRKPFLILSIVSNLGLLFTFKYLDFFTQSTNLFIGTSIPAMEFILPMGISFYTFQTLSYSIDIYRGEIKAEPHLGKFALFVSFFPQLVAGPIERAKTLLPQLRRNNNQPQYERIVSGLSQMTLGFFKKVVVADTAALYVDSIYNYHEVYSGFTLVFATYIFAWQIYCDFSGYADIAIGAAKIMGYDLSMNFNLPYFTTSITNFWRHWHITLSTWLKDYLYIPLGGNRLGHSKMLRNIFLTMLVGGIWHGAGWTYIIWGALNGIAMVLERQFGLVNYFEAKGRLMKIMGVIFSWHVMAFAWVFFRSESLDQAMTIFGKIFTIDNFANLQIKDTSVFSSMMLTIFILFALELMVFRKWKFDQMLPKFGPAVMISFKAILIIFIILFGISDGNQFIYFQF